MNTEENVANSLIQRALRKGSRLLKHAGNSLVHRGISLLEQGKDILDSRNLRNFEKKYFSQNAEDGIVEEIFRRIGTTNNFFVEIGVNSNGTQPECNTRQLLERGWKGLWLEGNEEHIHSLRPQTAGLPVEVRHAFVSAENVRSLFENAGVPTEFDLLSIDIDGNDYWIWKALDAFRPRVAIVEYNSSFGRYAQWVMPYNPNHLWTDFSNYYGASLAALEKLGVKMGYSLVGCDGRGVNAFFVRTDLIGTEFSHPRGGSSYHYVIGKYHYPLPGWPPRNS